MNALTYNNSPDQRALSNDRSNANSNVSTADRLGLTLFLAFIIHALIILGITFEAQPPSKTDQARLPLEITLVHQRSETAPEKAEFLAQANLEGGGNSEKPDRPRSPASTPLAMQQQGMSEQITLPSSPPETQTQDDTLTQTESTQKVVTNEHRKMQEIAAPVSKQLSQLNLEIANLSAEIDISIQTFAKKQRHRYISARTREYRDAAYLDAWRAKIERVGNINYPEAAKRLGLSGTLILDVGLKPNGRIDSITVQRSSGHKILDDAARRIVRLAAPFSPFPDEMRKDTDILHIIRSWQFLNNHKLETSR